MTTILPSARSSWDVIGDMIGQNLNQTLPGAVNQGYQRGLGLNALDKAEQDISQAGGDPFKIALAFAKAGAQNPNLERSLGPLYQSALQQSRVQGAYGQPQQQEPNARSVVAPGNIPLVQQPTEENQFVQSDALKSSGPSPATPGPFNIITPDQMDVEAKRFAGVMNDPNAYQTRFAQLQNQNQTADAQRQALEETALRQGVKSDELPLFMKVASQFDPRNPTEWARKSDVAWKEAKNNMDKIDRAFIPGLGQGLLGMNREPALKNLEGSVKDLIKSGLEQETRMKLSDNYLTPTEIESLIHPLTPQKEKSITSLPKGTFPFVGPEATSFFGGKERPFISFEEAQEKAPKELQMMQNILSEFFKKNVDKDTSLLALRDKIIKDKDYDWRQIGPSIRQAMSEGLELQPFQSTEMTDIDTQAPYDSLPDIFQSLDRAVKFMRGNK